MPAPASQRERVVAKVKKVRPTAHAVKLTGALEIIGKRYRVDGKVLVEHLAHSNVDLGVARQIEILGTEVDEAFLKGLLRDHHRGEDGGLRLWILRHRLADRFGHPRWIDVIGILGHYPSRLSRQ